MKNKNLILLSIIIIPLLMRGVLYPIIIEHPILIGDDKAIAGGAYNPITDKMTGNVPDVIEHEQTHKSMRPLLLLIYPLLFFTYWSFMYDKPYAKRIWGSKVLFVGSIEIITYAKQGEWLSVAGVYLFMLLSFFSILYVFYWVFLEYEATRKDILPAFAVGLIFGVL